MFDFLPETTSATPLNSAQTKNVNLRQTKPRTEANSGP